MRKTAILLSSGLLLISAQSLAQRPAMNEPPTASSRPAPVQATAAEENFRPVANQSTPEKPAVQAEPEPAAAPAQTQQTVSTGDVLEMQPGETFPVRILNFPRRGTTMDKVQNELGQPREISSTIGEPPITSWSYDDRVVYFEHSRVIHTVSSK